MVAGVGIAGLIGLVAIVLAIALSGGGAGRPAGRSGCVTVGLAYSTGGQEVDRCGAAARAGCAGVGRPGGITGGPARTVAAACRRAGLPVG